MNIVSTFFTILVFVSLTIAVHLNSRDQSQHIYYGNRAYTHSSTNTARQFGSYNYKRSLWFPIAAFLFSLATYARGLNFGQPHYGGNFFPNYYGNQYPYYSAGSGFYGNYGLNFGPGMHSPYLTQGLGYFGNYFNLSFNSMLPLNGSSLRWILTAALLLLLLWDR